MNILQIDPIIIQHCKTNGLASAAAWRRSMSEVFPTHFQRLGILLIALFLPILARAQLVDDGQTNILSGVVSNISEPVTVGTNGSFTLLIVTNGSALFNTIGGLNIGLNHSAQSNRVIVTGSQWLGISSLTYQYSGTTVGYSGSGNELDILNGGVVSDGSGFIGYGFGNSNLAVVSDPGSIWTNLDVVGFNGSFNTLVVSNGGQVFSDNGEAIIGESSGSGNRAIVTGPGSLWANGSNGTFYLGAEGSSNQLLVTDSGEFAVGDLYLGGSSRSQYNQLTVSNSGVVTVEILTLALGGWSNSVTIDGGTVVVTNMAVLSYGTTITLNSGRFAPSSLISTSIGGKFIFNGGTMQSGGTGYITYPSAPLVVGDGTDAALYTMLGGTHSFPGLIISSNAVLNGSGTVTANVSINNGGTIAPGTNNLGTIILNGALTLSAGSTTLMKLNASASTSDMFTGIGNLVYGGTLQLTNVSGSYSAGQSFSLFAATNYAGAFAALIPASPGPGLQWDTNEFSVDGVLRVFSTTTPAPVIGSVTAANGNLLISASGGIPYDPCYLLTSTNLATPVSNWSCITTNYFDSTGATTFTNAISTDQTQQYFRLQVN